MVIAVLVIAAFAGIIVAQYYLMWLGMRKGLNWSKLRAFVAFIIFFMLAAIATVAIESIQL